MHRSSESIAALAAALAKAQSELSNPEKSLVATIGADRPGEGARTFRYAPLSSGLDIVRKALGQQQIATVQTTAIDATTGTVNLTTVLAHASGEWIASDWPVCRLADTAAPHRMGAALTYARRYALFTLVGIAGEDDLDAPDLNRRPQADGGAAAASGPMEPGRHDRVRQPPGNGRNLGWSVLPADGSAVLRDRLVGEIAEFGSAADAAQWARTALASKNMLTALDARTLELAFELRVSAFEAIEAAPGNPSGKRRAAAAAVGRSSGWSGPEWSASEPQSRGAASPKPTEAPKAPGIDKSVLVFPEPRRHRDKAHIKFVAAQPCLVCGRRPSDPHHLRFAQRPALGRKVSDEFAVPLCRLHHRELHRSRNEASWWKKLGLDPIKIARQLWDRTRSSPPAPSMPPDGPPAGQNKPAAARLSQHGVGIPAHGTKPQVTQPAASARGEP
jgi:hypothetical protein